MPGIYLAILFAPMFVILFWGVELLIGSLKKDRVKQNLAFFMLCGFVAILAGIAFFLKYYKFYNSTYVFNVFFALSQFPSFYIYIYLLTSENSYSKKKIFIHYIYPFAAFLTAIFIHWIWFSPEENMEFVTQYLTGNSAEVQKLNIAFITDKVYKITFILFGVFYYWLVNKRVKEHREKMNNYFSNTEKVNLNWIKIFNILFLLTLISGIFYHGQNRDFFVKNPSFIAIPYGLQTLFYWVIGHFGSSQKEIYTHNTITEVSEELQQTINTLPLEFKTKLSEIMQTNKPYLNPELSLNDLAKISGTNRTYLSKFINETYNQNFKQFINDFRIKEAELLLINQPDWDIVQISMHCGFGSYHTFNRCFKEKNQITPSNYRNRN